MSAAFQIRFEPAEIRKWAALYVEKNPDQVREDKIMHEIVPRVRRTGYFGRDDFLEVCRWKSPRNVHNCERNDEAFIENATATAFQADEHLRVPALSKLNGVGWAVASVLLHIGHRDPYPIKDYRALWSLSTYEPAQYDWEFWREYVAASRQLADENNVDMRTLDRALWQYSKEHQPARGGG